MSQHPCRPALLVALLCGLLTASSAEAEPKLAAVLPLSGQYSKLPPSAVSVLEESLRSRVGDVLTPLGFVVLTQENMLSVIRDNGIDAAKACEASCAVGVGQELKAKYIFSGSIATNDGVHSVFIRFFDVESGALLSSIKLRGRQVSELEDQFDRSWRTLFEKAGFKVKVEAGMRDAVEVTAVDSASAVPLPAPIPQEAIQLDVDADVLVAHDAALQADANGEKDPAGASAAWSKLAGMKGPNPYKAKAQSRAREWKEFADRLAARKAQRQSDSDKLKKILPLASIPSEQKAELSARYVVTYGLEAATEVRALVSAAQWIATCERLPAEAASKLETRLEVRASDLSGRVQPGRIVVDGRVLGDTPATVPVSLCARNLTVEHGQTKEPWNAELSSVCVPGKPCVIQARFTDLIEQKELPSYAEVPQDLVNLLNTHPAFRGVPAVKPVETRKVWDTQYARYVTTTAQRLRNGLIESESSMLSDGSSQSDTSLSFLGGLVDLAHTSSAQSRGGSGTSSSHLTAISNVRGSLFPLAKGKTLSFRAVGFKVENGRQQETTVDYSFEVMNEIDGETVLKGLPGKVFVIADRSVFPQFKRDIGVFWSSEYNVMLCGDSPSIKLERVAPLPGR